MGKRILLVLTGRDRETEVLRRISGDNNNIEEVFLCPIEYNADRLAQQLKKSLEKKTTIEAELVDFIYRFNKKAFELKQEYINFIHELGEKDFFNGINLKRYFTYPSGEFSVWWFSLIAEKNPYKSSAFTKFCKILTILHLKNELGCEQIWLNRKNGVIGNVLSASGLDDFVSISGYRSYHGYTGEIKLIFIEMLRVAKFILALLQRAIGAKRLERRFKNQREYLRDSKILAVTAFPSVDETKLKDGRFVNLAYGSLQNSIESNHKNKVAWLGMFVPINSYNWSKTLKIAKRVKENSKFFILEEWLGYKEFSRIIFTYFLLSVRALINLNRYRAHFVYRDPVTNLRINLWEILKKDFLSSFMGKILIWGISNYIAFSNIIEDLPKYIKVLYFAEMQSWEKALIVACAKRGDITCVGMQHSIVPLLMLNYFDHPEDLRGNDYVKYCPAPDYLGCVGSITRDILLQGCWPREKLFILGGFRFHDFRESPDILTIKERRKGQVVVPFSLCPLENREMLLLLFHAFNDKNLNFDILLKTHPCDPIQKVARRMGLDINSKVFKFTNKRLQEIIPESKAMIVKESSSVFWAIYNGIPVIVPSLYSIIDLCPLSKLSNLAIYINNPVELFNTVIRIMQNRRDIDGNGYRKFLNKYLNIYLDDKQYYDNLLRSVEG